MLSNDKNIETLAQLIENVKEYIGLQKEYLKFDVTEKIIRLASGFVLVIIIFALTISMLLYISLAAIHWISPFVGVAGAYAIAACSFLLLALAVYVFRKSWIEKPIAKFIAKILLSK